MADLPNFDPYEVLGVDRTAEPIVIKKAFRKLALQKHPDKCKDDELRQERTDEFQRLNQAYAILGDDDERSRYDALMRLEALRKERARMGGPGPGGRGLQRAQTFAYPATANTTAYTSRGPTNVQDRAPRGYADETDIPDYSRQHNEDYFGTSRRPAGGASRPAERPRADRDDERRRDQRRREDQARQDQIRQERARKEAEQERYTQWQEEKRQRDDMERKRRAAAAAPPPRTADPEIDINDLGHKYASMAETAQQYTESNRSKPPTTAQRPGMTRRTSTRDPTRSSARRSPSERDPRVEREKLAREERERIRLQQQLERERERAAEERQRNEYYVRDRAARKAEKAERDRLAAERDREAREAREARIQAEKLQQQQDARVEQQRAEARETTRREAEERRLRDDREKARRRAERDDGAVPQRTTKENVEPYTKRPPILQHHNSSPPIVNSDYGAPTRHRTEPPTSEAPYPSMPRARTMDSVPTSNTSARRNATATASSKLRDSVLPDSGYSSSGTNGSGTAKAQRPAKPVKTTSYLYAQQEPSGSSARPVQVDPRYQTETRVPTTASSRRRSPSVERPSATATKMHTLASMVPPRGEARRPSSSYGTEKRPSTSAGSRAVPRARSPERSSRRDRDRDYSRDKLYGERTPGYPSTPSYPSNQDYPVSYSKRFTNDDIAFSRPTSSRRTSSTAKDYNPFASMRTGRNYPISTQ
ncbi:hypothetical protein BT63DRAFT_456409 [Microthyrium microscopicum]|uniref:J domain-containing protein n=1 Tax=Microthyrium microscopicum TaxID=703497 RepID=A0A6A6UCD5_9PEZI|nr:hypothetical protein BT63DRAFT_456409 [Microthyrium microscopicum]